MLELSLRGNLAIIDGLSMTLLFVSLLTFSARFASAQTPDVEARRLFEAGRRAYDDGRYAVALRQFERAYALSQRPALLYNVGVAADRLGRNDRALAAFEQYLREVPAGEDDDQRAEAEARVTLLRENQSPQDVARPTAVPVVPSHASAARPVDDPVPASDGLGALPWVFIVGGSVVAIGGGVLVGLSASDIDSVENAPPGTPWSEVEAANDRAPVFSGIGFAMLGVGVISLGVGFVLLTADDEGATVALTPNGLRIAGTF